MLCRLLLPYFLLVYSLAVFDLGWNTPVVVVAAAAAAAAVVGVVTALVVQNLCSEVELP